MSDDAITIEKVVFGGKGLSRDRGRVTFVPYTLPGEKVRVRVTRQRRDYFEAEPVEIVEPVAQRVPPDCRYFGQCGGCQMSHARYEFQLDLKRAMLEEALKRNGIPFPPIETISGQPFEYRHRAQLKYDPQHRRLGFYERDTNKIVDIRECLCLTPGLNQLLKELRSVLTACPLPALKEILCYENDSGETAIHTNVPLPAEIAGALAKHCTLLNSKDSFLTLRFRDYEFPMHPDIFVQVNPKLWKELVQEVESHHEPSDRVAVELYCGAGFFTLPLSKRFRRIHACEENPAAIRYAKEHFPLPEIEWNCAPAEEYVVPEDASVAIVDPPRTGLHKNVVASFLAHPLQKISYISCDAPSFARDVRQLTASYSIKRLTLLDLFPQTFHFETIALLERR